GPPAGPRRHCGNSGGRAGGYRSTGERLGLGFASPDQDTEQRMRAHHARVRSPRRRRCRTRPTTLSTTAPPTWRSSRSGMAPVGSTAAIAAASAIVDGARRHLP
ncbi:hypothetical protein ACFVRU_60835, partial [Streptomyces sp. NPDC057927]